jgi:hypothetical protein
MMAFSQKGTQMSNRTATGFTLIELRCWSDLLHGPAHGSVRNSFYFDGHEEPKPAW